MTRAKTANNASTTLSAAIISTGATSFSVISATGFPSLGAGEYFYATLLDSAVVPEIVKVTATAGVTFTCVRAQDGTAARTFLSTATVKINMVAALLNELAPLDGATLSNATLTGPTLSNATAELNGSSSVPMRGYIDGLGQSSPGGSSNHTITPGVATDSANAGLMRLSAALTKTTLNWTVGTAGGGKSRAAALEANTSYFNYLIRRQDTGVVDVCFSPSATGLVAADFVAAGGGNLPDAYTQWRRIHGLRTDGAGQWFAMSSSGDEVALTTAVSFTTGAPVSGPNNVVLTGIPIGAVVTAKLSGYCTDATTLFNAGIYPVGQAPGAGAYAGIVCVGTAGSYSAISGTVRSNSSGQVVVNNITGAAMTLNTWVDGWRDTRGRDA